MICDYFEPTNTIGAVRPTEFAKCFELLGHDVEVVTLLNSEWPLNQGALNTCKITRINVDLDKNFKRYRKLLKFKNKSAPNHTNESRVCSGKNTIRKRNVFSKIIVALKNYYYDHLKVVFGKCSMKAYIEYLNCQDNDYDVVYTTYSGFGSLLAGEVIKKKNKQVKWIVDIRDAIYYDMFVKTHKTYFKKFLIRHCKKANLFSFVSNGVLSDSILPHNKKYKTEVITNGFYKYNESVASQHNKLTLLYAGVIYDERKFSSIFMSIKKLEEDFKQVLNLEILFYGGKECFSKFISEAERYSIKKYIKYCGFVDRDSLSLVEKEVADIFLISSWNYKDYKGVIPGKIFEYMSFRKPILGHVTGDLNNSDIKRIINDGEIGFCADDIEKDDYDKMYEYIRKQYLYYLQHGKCFYDGKKEFTDTFLRINLAKKIINSIKEVGTNDDYRNI